MKVYHEEHQTAWSARTSGLLMTFHDRDGNPIATARSTKRECWLDAPDSAEYLIVWYVTNSGKLSPFGFAIRDQKLVRLSKDELPDWVENERMSRLPGGPQHGD